MIEDKLAYTNFEAQKMHECWVGVLALSRVYLDEESEMLKQYMIVWLLLTGACAINEPVDAVSVVKEKQHPILSEGKSGIYVYRLNQRRGAGFVTNIWMDGKCMGMSGGGDVFYAEVDGNQEHVIGAGYDGPLDLLTLVTEKGNNYFVEHHVNLLGVEGVNHFKLVDQAVGKAAIVDLIAAKKDSCN